MLTIRDHPRGCGEHTLPSLPLLTEKGSSPRMRGAHHFDDRGHISLRIIPADAGSTCVVTHWSYPLEDHPRGCGEHTICTLSFPSGQGSSPRMRGALTTEGRPCQAPRIIPADAGSTLFHSDR